MPLDAPRPGRLPEREDREELTRQLEEQVLSELDHIHVPVHLQIQLSALIRAQVEEQLG